MSPDELRQLLDRVRDGETSLADAHQTLLAALRAEPLADLGFARVDHHRPIRQGFPEVVLGLGKTPDQIASIAVSIAGRGQPLLVTRADAAAWDAVRAQLSEARYHDVARAITLAREVPRGRGSVAVASAGTSDIPVAEEAAVTAELLGNDVERLYDVGVAGIHRVLRERHRLETARVIVVVAGMEGALPSVVGGLVDVPIIAVPTSIGYGTAAKGFTALFAMLTSCASGITVVNIDNGFGAAFAAARILRMRAKT